MTAIDIQIIAYGLLGIALVYWTKKRRFERTSIQGTELFPTYQHKLKTKLVDALLLGLGAGGILCAVLLIFIEYAPVWGFLILLLGAALAFEKDLYQFKRNQ